MVWFRFYSTSIIFGTIKDFSSFRTTISRIHRGFRTDSHVMARSLSLCALSLALSLSLSVNLSALSLSSARSLALSLCSLSLALSLCALSLSLSLSRSLSALTKIAISRRPVHAALISLIAQIAGDQGFRLPPSARGLKRAFSFGWPCRTSTCMGVCCWYGQKVQYLGARCVWR